ncbi:MAG: hypothetical protein ACW990_13355, partial [Promethearchaeota archaeon]
IKMNISELMMALIFKGIFLGKDIILIYNDQFLANRIINFFNYVKNDLFKQNIIAMPKSDYRDKWEDYDDHLVLEKAVVLRNNNPLIDLKKIGVEKRFVKRFLGEDNLVTGLIILRNEIKKAYEFSNNLAKLLESTTIKDWNSKMLIDHINHAYSEKIQKSYLSFLLVIVEHYFKVKVPNFNKSSKFLDFL